MFTLYHKIRYKDTPHDTTTYMMSVVKALLSPHDDDGKQKDVELEQRISAIEQRDGEMQAKLDTAFQVFSAPGRGSWKDNIEINLKGIAEAKGIHTIKVKGALYKGWKRLLVLTSIPGFQDAAFA